MQAAHALATVPNPDATRRPWASHSRGVTTYKEPKEATVKVERARNDVVGLMYDRRQIGDVLLKTAREFQKVHEAAGDHQRSSGDLREWVDGGRPPRDGVTDNQVKAMKLIIGWERKLGEKGYALLVEVLLNNRTIRHVADHSRDMMPSRMSTVVHGHMFKQHLATLSKAMGYA